MEKYSQYRDRGTQIAPFLEIPNSRTVSHLPVALVLFFFRLPLLAFLSVSFFLVLQWIPLGSLVRKAWIWMILLCSGVWWVDLQVEGVKKGSLAKQSTKLPRAGSVIVSSYTSPIDILYLAAVFDPIFTASYPTLQKVERLTLLSAFLRSLSPPRPTPPPGTSLYTLTHLIRSNPNRIIAVFPECTPTNGRGILRFSPSLNTTPVSLGTKDSIPTPIFPINIRYTPADVTTPIPNNYLKFLWNLVTRPTHCMRVRIAEAIYNTPYAYNAAPPSYYESISAGAGEGIPEVETEESEAVESHDEDKQSELCIKVAESLARMGRVKRLDLGVKEKEGFVNAWTGNKKGGDSGVSGRYASNTSSTSSSPRCK